MNPNANTLMWRLWVTFLGACGLLPWWRVLVSPSRWDWLPIAGLIGAVALYAMLVVTNWHGLRDAENARRRLPMRAQLLGSGWVAAGVVASLAIGTLGAAVVWMRALT